METPISLSQIGLYNPQRQSAEVTEALFVVRQKQFELLLNRIVQEKENSIPQHHLIIGQRGMGKTTMLKRMEVELHKPQYRRQFIPLLFPEEQYNVKDLAEFWLNCLDALADSLELEKYPAEKIADIDKKIKELSEKSLSEVSEEAYKFLMDICRDLHRRPVLLIDNIGLVFDRLDKNKKTKQEQWALRKLLSENGAPVVVSAGVTTTSDVAHYKMPFYDFFQIQYLKKLRFEEFTELLENLANRTQIDTDIKSLMHKEKPRLQTLYQFTGGNPRTAVMLFKLLVKGFSADINDDLDALVDEVTPLYKAKFEELPQQQQIIIDAIAMNWDAISLKELSTATHLENSQLSPQLKRLIDEGWVETTPAYEAKGNAYSISERFFNVWFLMRRSNRRQKKGIHSLSEFLECLYGQDRMMQEANRFLQCETMCHRQIMRGLSYSESKLLDPETKNKLKEKAYDAVLHLSEKDEEILKEYDIPMEYLEERFLTFNIDKIRDLTGKLKSEDADFWWDISYSLQVEKQYEKAIVCYTKAIELNPDDAEAYYNRGNAYESINAYETAITDYTKAIELNPDDAKAYCNRGSAYGLINDYETAIADFTKAIELNPDVAEAYHNRGLTYYLLNDYETAIADFTKAIELNPDLAEAWIWKGNCYLAKAELELYNQNKGLAKENLLQAFEIFEQKDELANMANSRWWIKVGYTVIKLGYGSWLLEILEEKGYDIVLSPYYTAIQALEIETQNKKNGKKEAEIYLKNRAVEISEPARMIIEKIRKYMD